MAAPNLLRKVRLNGKWKMLPVASKGKRGADLRHDLTRVVVAGVPTVVTYGTFYLEFRDQGRRVRRAVGEHPRDVKAALATQASVLGLRRQGIEVEDAPQLKSRTKIEGKTIRQVVEGFAKAPPLEYRRRSFLTYRNALKTFLAWTTKTHVVQIEREHIKAFMSAVVLEDGLDPSTAVDKAAAVVKIMRDQGAPIVMRKGDWPRLTERQPEVYRPEILKKLFAAAKPDEYTLFQTFLLTGMREQEVSHLAWTDFDAARSTLRVSKKPGFDPKNYQERTVPVPSVLVELLKAHRQRQVEAKRDEVLIFPTSRHNLNKGAPGGQADGHLLRRLKRLAHRAGINCGRCSGRRNGKPATCVGAPICSGFGLHKFRHTYATTILRDGVDLVSVQKLLGHNDLASTRKYLRALEPDELLAKINLTSLATRYV